MNTQNNTPETITIQLTQGQSAVVSAIDADLADFKWRAVAMRGGFRAVRTSTSPNPAAIYLHRVILERVLGRSLTKTELVDHINGSTIDNRRENLRISTNAENGRNRGAQRNNTSGFKGVTWDRAKGKWLAQIMISGKQKHLGRFDTPELAHAAYCEAALKYHGEFANTGER